MKAMKKLNFWSKKKRKKKDYYYHYQKLPHYSHNYYNYNFQPYYNPPPPPLPPPYPPPPLPPPPENCECHFCHPAEPSAPPLPPWIEEGISSNFTFENSTNNNDHDEMGSVGPTPTLSHGVSRDNDMATTPSSSSQLQEIVTANTTSGLGLGLGLSPKNKAGAVGLFGCVVDVGGLLFRCIFPCFHISDPRSLPVADHHMENKTF